MTSIFLHGPGSWGLHRANEVPRSHRQAAVISPRSSRASHRQYLTIAHSAQQQVGVGRDPSPTRRSSLSVARATIQLSERSIFSGAERPSLRDRRDQSYERGDVAELIAQEITQAKRA